MKARPFVVDNSLQQAAVCGGIRGGENLLLAACSTLMTLYVTGCFAKLFIVMIAERPKRSPCETRKLGKSFEIHCVDNIQK